MYSVMITNSVDKVLEFGLTIATLAVVAAAYIPRRYHVMRRRRKKDSGSQL